MTLKKNLFAALAVGCALAMSANSASAHLSAAASCGSSGGSGVVVRSGSWGGSLADRGVRVVRAAVRTAATCRLR